MVKPIAQNNIQSSYQHRDETSAKVVNLTTGSIRAKMDSEIKRFAEKKGKSLEDISTPNSNQTIQHKTIVELDLVAYSDIARCLEQTIGAIGVTLLERKIQKLVDQGLRQVGLSRAETFMQTSGDNAILAFDSAEQAHSFAQAVLSINQTDNQQKSIALARMQYRIGIATGELVIYNDDLESACGIVITDAVRLESAAAAAQIVIDCATYHALPTELQRLYGGEEMITGKRAEVFQAHRYSLEPAAQRQPVTKALLKKSLLWTALDYLFGLSGFGERRTVAPSN